jgi:gibberellin 3-beta-dioxygenase
MFALLAIDKMRVVWGPGDACGYGSPPPSDPPLGEELEAG